MKKFIFFYLISLFFVSFAFAKSPVERVQVPVTITVSNKNFATTISICNTTTGIIPLTDIELNFNYTSVMPSNIWGLPWAAWKVRSQQDGKVVLIGGTTTALGLQPDPNCQKPLTVSFTASPDLPLPTGPFVFKAAGASGGDTPTRPDSWNKIKHIVLIIFENTSAADTLKQPFFKSLTMKGAYLNQFYAITHPSQPNYIALIAGSTLGVISDAKVTVDAMHIGNLLDAKGKTWKAYAEDLPNKPCFLGTSSHGYARKHEPFISFKNIQNSTAQCAKIVPGSDFFVDLSNHNLPDFSLFIPNQYNDGHDTGVEFADNWYQSTFAAIFNDESILQDTLFITTFDEDNFTAKNHIYTSLLGAAVKPGAQSNNRYTHYSLLRTIEEIYELGTLEAKDSTAPIISDVWLP